MDPDHDMRDAAARRGLRSPDAFVALDAADCEASIHLRFERQAVRRPDAVAVRLPEGDVAYAELNTLANRAARALLARVGADAKPVALMLDQGYASVLWTLAVLKAGLPYAPLDQRLPVPVLRAMIDDLDPGAIVADSAYLVAGRDLAAARFPVIDADLCSVRADGGFASTNLDRAVAADDVAYVFYTSGSTGAPKGVADSHRNVLRNVLRYTNTLRLAAADTLSLVQNPSFSGTVSSLFGALCNGAAIAPFDLQGEGLQALSPWLRRAQVTVFHGVPSIFRQLSDPASRFPCVRVVRLEGDRCTALDLTHFHAHFNAECTLVNGLGATECGLVRQYFIDHAASAAAAEPVPIGYAVPDVTMGIVDDEGRALPPGSTGEIVVEGKYLALGYWRNPALTAQRFADLGGGMRRYRTGDLGRMDAGGAVTHLGRVDHRIRIAGEFVDPGAIERVLVRVPGIAQGAVRAFVDQAGERQLCAYVVADAAGVTVDQLRAALSAVMATHLVPAAYVFLDALPLTKDLKVDPAGLPPPGRQRPPLPHDAVAPRTALERHLARIWSEVLEIDLVGVTDSFFDLGGDSLRAAQVANRLRDRHGLAIKVASLFEHLTIRALAADLDGGIAIATPSVVERSNDPWPAHSIAVIGMAGRFPGADSIDEFWANLRAGRESITFFRPEDLEAGSPIDGEPGTVAARGLLADTDQFDAALFRLTPRQAAMLDPQQRVWLECVHQAMEDAGLPTGAREHARDGPSIGVFAGARESTYLWHLVGGNPEAVDALLHRSSDEAYQLLIANDHDSIATRTSFLLGFTGPSINVQTACSTSLVAVAQALDALVSRQCDVAIAGGVAVTFPQKRSYRYTESGILSHDGHCRAFDASATGTVFSDGVGVVVLKRLRDALADGDRIAAVIRGWAVNNDGASKASFTAPSAQGQAYVVARAQDHAGTAPQEVSYVEAHGAATPVGDPIEFAGLARAFRRGTAASGFCGLGSVKSNIGHLDTAAGIAGLIKTVLALEHREIPPTLHFERPNPEIVLEGSPFYIADRLRAWTTGTGARIAGVSSLGVGGTNCHLVVQEAAQAAEAEAHRAQSSGAPAHLVTLSAASAPALDALETNFRQYLAGDSIPDLAAIAATTQASRSHHAYRCAIVGSDAAQIRDRLAGARESDAARGYWRAKASQAAEPDIAFLFSGQGSQYAGMGQSLYAANGDFRGLLQRCDRILRGHLERPLLDVMWADAGDARLIQRTEYAQPALFALQYSLAELLRRWGIRPRHVLGHSIGEYAAACVAGVFSLEQGIALAAARGRLMQQVPGIGRMLAVRAPLEQVVEWLRSSTDDVSIAAINSPTQVVVSGDEAAIGGLQSLLEEAGVTFRELTVSHAFHSAQMNPVLQPLAELAAKIELRSPSLRLISNLYGRAVTTEVTDPAYWRDHARQPVQFAAGIAALVTDGCELFVEIGPDSVLTHLAQEAAGKRSIVTLPTLRRGDNDWSALLETIGHLHVRGSRIDWRVMRGGELYRPARLPPYPFQRARHWYRGELAQRSAPTRATGVAGHPLLGRRLRVAGSDEIRFEARFSQAAPTFVADHRLFGVPLPPGASHFAMLAQAADCLGPGGSTGATCRVFEDLYLLRPLLLPEGTERDVQLAFRPGQPHWSLELNSSAAADGGEAHDEWTLHMTGKACLSAAPANGNAGRGLDLAAVKARCPNELSGSDFYSMIWANQGGTGSAFRWIASIRHGNGEALCHAICPAGLADVALYRLHPGLIEAACQALHCCATIETREALEREGVTYVPFSVDAFHLFDVQATHDNAWCHARLRDRRDDHVVADLSILTATGRLVAKLEGFCLRPITREAVSAPIPQPPPRSTTAPAVRPNPGGVATGRSDRPAPSEQEMLRYLQAQCAELSGFETAQIHPNAGFLALGLDSIVAAMLANHLLRDFGRRITIGRILASHSIGALAHDICAGGAG